MIKKLADRLFEWFCNPLYYDDIRGDLEELYAQKEKGTNKWMTDLLYVKEILLLFRLSLMRPSLFSNLFNSPWMIKNNLRIALRHMWKQKLYTIIKIGGLAFGIAAFLLLAIYLQHEWAYDTHYPDQDRIYRVTAKYLKEGTAGVDFPAPFATALREDFSEVETSGRLIAAKWLNQIRTADDFQNRYTEGFAYVDASLLEILKPPLVEGDYEKTMEAPNTVLISESKAKLYFPRKSAVDQLLIINNNKEHPLRVVGVFEDFPSNSHLNYDFLISMAGVEFWPGEQTYWGANMYDTYALVQSETNVAALNEKLSDLIQNYFLPSWKEREFVNPEEIAANMELELQPIQDIYLGSSTIRDGLPHGDKRLFALFGFASLLIVLIACINFINLSTARYTVRRKEISIRKVVGATQGQVIYQFLFESVLFSLFSFLIAGALVWLLLPLMGHMLGKSLVFPWSLFSTIPVFLIAVLLVGLLTGLYPSIFLSNVSSIFSRNQSKASRGPVFQNLLVVFQFVISVTLIICTLVVYKQMHFILNKDVGFDKEQLLIVRGTNVLGEQLNAFKSSLSQISGVEQMSVSDYLPIADTRRYEDSFWENGQQNAIDGVNAQIWQVDPNYLQTLGMELIEGRNFSATKSTDSTAIIISQSLAQKLSFESPIGKVITNKEKQWHIIGVMDDFHFKPLKHEISPTCLVLGESASILTLRMETSESGTLIAEVNETWKKFAPDTQFRYELMDESFATVHQDVQRSARLFNVFAGLAILIACLGLFGLTAFITERRNKEIGIRKVLGASVSGIIQLISKDFVQLVLLSIIIAVPIGWYIMQLWLEQFPYRTNLGVWVFVWAAIISLLIAFLTTSFHSLKSALANPVEAIRAE